jgi:2-iminobutanoate/2-iminopropanoate deaminase
MSLGFTASKTIRATPVAFRLSRAASSHARATPVRAMAKEIISTDKSPAALGPYNQAVKAGNMVFVSGQIGLTPAMEFAGETIEEQTEQVMKNIGEVLAAAGASYSDVVKTTIMLANMDDFKVVNGIYGKCFPENAPARATIEAKGLPLGALVEIDAIAVVDA